MNNPEQDDVITGGGSESRSRMTRASFLAGAGFGALSLAAAGCGSQTSTAATSANGTDGPSKTIVWAIDQPASWETPVDVGFHDAVNLLGWKYQKAALGTSTSTGATEVEAMSRAALTKPAVLAADWWYQPQGAEFARVQNSGIMAIAIESDGFPAQRKKLGIPYVGVDNYLSGFTLATRMAQDLTSKGKSSGVFLSGIPFPGAENLQVQDQAIRAGFKQWNQQHQTAFTVQSFEDFADSNLSQSSEVWHAKVVEVGNNLVGGTSGSDNFAQIITNVLQGMGRKPGEYVLGAFRAAPGTLRGIASGWIAASSDQSYYPIGFVATIYAWMWLERQMTPEDYVTGGALIDSSNLAFIEKREARIDALAKQYGLQVA